MSHFQGTRLVVAKMKPTDKSLFDKDLPAGRLVFLTCFRVRIGIDIF